MTAAADQLKITRIYRDDHWVIRAEMLPVTNGAVPLEVFIHENNGTAQLGKYVGICSMEELQRLQVWTGSTIKKFGNRYVRYRTAEIHLPKGQDPAPAVAIIRQNLASLRVALLSSAESSTVYPIG